MTHVIKKRVQGKTLNLCHPSCTNSGHLYEKRGSLAKKIIIHSRERKFIIFIFLLSSNFNRTLIWVLSVLFRYPPRWNQSQQASQVFTNQSTCEGKNLATSPTYKKYSCRNMWTLIWLNSFDHLVNKTKWVWK